MWIIITMDYALNWCFNRLPEFNTCLWLKELSVWTPLIYLKPRKTMVSQWWIITLRGPTNDHSAFTHGETKNTNHNISSPSLQNIFTQVLVVRQGIFSFRGINLDLFHRFPLVFIDWSWLHKLRWNRCFCFFAWLQFGKVMLLRIQYVLMTIHFEI